MILVLHFFVSFSFICNISVTNQVVVLYVFVDKQFQRLCVGLMTCGQQYHFVLLTTRITLARHLTFVVYIQQNTNKNYNSNKIL
jgi:hypothetical protein